MKNNFFITMSIVTFNNSNIIKETVNNIVKNIPEEYDYQFYIIDNNSSDDTVNLLSEVSGNIKIIRLKDNKGFGYGHNQVLPLLSKYHLIINPDIRIKNQNQIRNMIEYMEKNSDVGLLSPLILNPDMSIQYLCKHNPTVFDLFIRRISKRLFSKRQDRFVMKDTKYDKIMRLEFASGSFMLFRSEIFNLVNGFDDAFFMYLEDADITRRVNQISKAIFYPFAEVIHFWERGSHKSIKLAIITVKSMIVYFKKWGLKIK